MATDTDKVVELRDILASDEKATFVVHMWDLYDRQRQEKKDEWLELDKYIFATDTSTTSNSKLPWKNSTTLPKLCQIRDNLHANYIASLFPNDKWLKWEGYTRKDASKRKARAITTYMDNKARESKMKVEVDKMLLDYIDRGNAFAMPSFENRFHDRNGERVQSYVGPKAVRINPMDIVFNPLATDFRYTPKIIRSLKTVGELKKLAKTHPGNEFWEEAMEKREMTKHKLVHGGFKAEDFDKAEMFTVDGFGNMWEYYMSDYVEVLEFYGDYHDQATGELKVNQHIVVVDRKHVALERTIDTYDGTDQIVHVGWRNRPYNLWAMGPLDNLVGLQYRIDHLENLKADAMDLTVHAPKKIFGEVEPFTWGPDEEIFIDEGGDVQTFAQDMNGVIVAENDITNLEMKMEMYAGAPREAAGIRTPGEKTAFEVQALENAAGRLFQVKITKFEEQLLEPLLNGMLEQAHRNFSGRVQVRALDDDLGVSEFMTITKEDITAEGVLRPVGARHFAQKAQELQNLLGVANSPLFNFVAPHTSGKALTKYFEDVLDVRGYDLFRPNVAIQEQKETQALANQAQEDLGVQAQTPTEEDAGIS